MLRRGCVSAALAIISAGSFAAGENPPSFNLESESLPNLISFYDAMNDRCRGGSGDDPKTYLFCERRDEAGSEISKRGWCWGPDDVAGSEKQWIECKKNGQVKAMPRFDVKSYCKKVAGFSGPQSEVIFRGCMTQEQSYYDDLKPAWAMVPSSIREYCTAVATFSGDGSYMILSGCIQQEIQARKENKGASFNY